MAKKTLNLEPFFPQWWRADSFNENRYALCKLLDLSEEAEFADYVSKWSKLNAMEKGKFFCAALDHGYWSSQRRMSEELHFLNDMDLNVMRGFINVARLPGLVKDAFRNPSGIKLLWAKRISVALARDPDIVLARSREICTSRARGERVTDAMVYKSLVASTAE